MIRSIQDHLIRFRDDEGGNATIEFCLFIPFFFVFFVSAFEMGMLMVRQTMLDRGVDLTVRLVRLNQVVDAAGNDAINRVNLRRSICFFSGGLVPDCDENLRIEMIRVDPHNWAATAGRAVAGGACVNVDDPANVSGILLESGNQNELMIIRVCALIEPLAPAAGIGAQMQRRSGDMYALFSMAAFVVEPDA